MPQIIKSYIRQPGALQDWFEVLVDEAIHIRRPSKLRNDDEIRSFGPLLWINDWVLDLALFQVPQPRKDPILQSDEETADTAKGNLPPIGTPLLGERRCYASCCALKREGGLI